jgi:acetyl esterase/lipase
MSLRAELVRLGLRWFVKRKIGPATTLEALRRQDAFLKRLVPPPPKSTVATHVDLDGVKAVAVVTPASRGSRLVLYLHGGGHVSGRRRSMVISPGVSPGRRAPVPLS